MQTRIAKLCVAFVVTTSTGCRLVREYEFTHVTGLPSSPGKVPLSAELRLSPEYCNFVHHYAVLQFPLGRILAEDAKLVAHHVFDNVVVVDNSQPNHASTANVVLRPSPPVIHWDMEPGEYAEESALSLHLEWVVETPQGATVWKDTARVVTYSPTTYGAFDSWDEGWQPNLQSALDAAFQRSARLILEAKALRDWHPQSPR